MLNAKAISLRAKISAVTTLSIVLVSIVLGSIYIDDQTTHIREFERRFLNDSVRSAATIAHTMAPYIVNEDFVSMNDLASYYSNRSDRVYVVIVDNGNRILASNRPGEIGGVFTMPAAYSTESVGEGLVRKYLRRGSEAVEVSYPVKAGDLVLGTVRMGLNVDWLRKETNVVRKTILVSSVTALAIISLGVILASAVARKISRPIMLLKETAEDIGKGNYEKRVGIRSGGEIGVLADALNKMAEDLGDSRARLVDKEYVDSIIANMSDVLIVSDTEGFIEMTNRAALNVLGYAEDELIGRPFSMLLDEGEFRAGAINKLIMEGFSGNTEISLISKDGRKIPVLLSGSALHGEGRVKGIICAAKDITERRKAEEALRESEEKMRTLFESANDAIFILDTSGNFVDVNKAGYERLGYTRDEMLALNVSRLDPPGFASRVPERIEQIRTKGQGVFESAHMKKDGTVIPVEVNARTVDLGGKTMIFSVIRDISERKDAEEKIRTSLREKEILLKEVHHRVKNNLQVVASMLRLQSAYMKDGEARVFFEECERRIESMSLVHEKLYRAQDLARIDFREYVDDLVANLSALTAGKSNRIGTLLAIDGIMLDVNTAIPCGLIITELVSNALRHAFPGGKKGSVGIRIVRDESGMIALSVGDNGIGFPEDIDFRNTQTLGMQLVTSLVVQLGGKMELDRSRGTCFNIAFRA